MTTLNITSHIDLTTEHSASSYGMPVLLVHGIPHASHETVEVAGRTAHDELDQWINPEPFFSAVRPEMDEEQENMVNRFLAA